MRKFFLYFMIIFGALLITLGIYTNLDKKEETNKEVKDEKIIVENPFNLEKTCTTYNKKNTYLISSSFKKISFNYPDCVLDYDLDNWKKNLKDKTNNLNININLKRQEKDILIKEYKSYLSNLNDVYKYDIQSNSLQTIKSLNDYEINLLETNYKKDNYYINLWFVTITLEKELTMTIEIESKNKAINENIIKEIYNSIKIEELSSLKNSKLEENVQKGSIKVNYYNNIDHGYKLNYEVSKDYPEVDSLATNTNTSIFEYKNNTEENYITLSINNINKNLIDEIKKEKDMTIFSYKDNEENYRNITETPILEENINNKKIIYFIYTYDYYLNNEKISTNYLSKVFYEVKPGIYVKISINNQNLLINNSFLSNFLNFNVEEY